MSGTTIGTLAGAGVTFLLAAAAYLRARTAHKTATDAQTTAKTALGVAAGAQQAPPSPMGQ